MIFMYSSSTLGAKGNQGEPMGIIGNQGEANGNLVDLTSWIWEGKVTGTQDAAETSSTEDEKLQTQS